MIIGIPILALCIFLVPELAVAVSDFLGIHSIKYIIFTLLYGGTLPFYIALYQAFKLLSYIDKNIAFSELSVRNLMRIKWSVKTAVSSHAIFVVNYIICTSKRNPLV